jgi:Zn-dependent protease
MPVIHQSIPTGRLPVRVHPSALLATGLIALLLATSVLPRQVPGLPSGRYAVAAAIGALVILASVLAHELAHAVLARRLGVGVKHVTLWALGGTTELDGEPPTPGTAFRIAGVGPLLSAVVGAGLVGVAFLTSGLAAAVAGWAGGTNLLLAAFNVLPGAPLDGGRLVAAAVWRRTGDRARGTLAAAKAGRWVGLLVLTGGALQATLGSLAGGIWLMAIGWFLAASARMEGTRVAMTGALRGLDAAAVMAPSTAAPGWLTVAAFLERVAEPSRDSVFALAAFDGTPAGVVFLPQLTAVPADQRSSVRAVAVGISIERITTVSPSDPAATLPGLLGPAGVVLVIADGAVVGMVTAGELTRAVVLHPSP